MLLSNNVTQGNININIIKPQNTNRLGKVLTNACFSEYFLSTLPQIGWDIHGCFIFFFLAFGWEDIECLRAFWRAETC